MIEAQLATDTEEARVLGQDLFHLNTGNRLHKCDDACELQFRQHNTFLRLVLSLPVLVTGFADFVGLEKQDLAQPFVGIDSCR